MTWPFLRGPEFRILAEDDVDSHGSARRARAWFADEIARPGCPSGRGVSAALIGARLFLRSEEAGGIWHDRVEEAVEFRFTGYL